MAAERIGTRVVKLDLSRPFTAARARNEGFAALRTLSPNIRYVQFIDGDCSLTDEWIAKAREFLELRADISVVCGRRRELYPTASVYNSICDIEWDTPIGEAASCGGDALMRVDAFEDVGGFRSNLIAGEEPELCVRLRQSGRKIWRLDADMTYHDSAMTRMGQFWARAVRAGYAYAEISRLHKNSSFGIWRRETARAVFWGGLLPLIICAGSLVNRSRVGGRVDLWISNLSNRHRPFAGLIPPDRGSTRCSLWSPNLRNSRASQSFIGVYLPEKNSVPDRIQMT